MDTAVVVDASVWASGLMPRDVNHSASRVWLRRYIIEGGIMVVPPFVLIEVAAAKAIYKKKICQASVTSVTNIPVPTETLETTVPNGDNCPKSHHPSTTCPNQKLMSQVSQFKKHSPSTFPYFTDKHPKPYSLNQSFVPL